jgi:trigger factor
VADENKTTPVADAEPVHAHEHGHDHAHEHEEKEKALEVSAKAEELGPCKRKMAVTVSAASVKEMYDGVFGEQVEHAVLPGFRPGRVPESIVRRKFGRAISAAVKEKLLGRAIENAMKQLDLEPISTPEFLEDESGGNPAGEPASADQAKEGGEKVKDMVLPGPKLDPDKEYTFNVSFEVRPTFAAPDYVGIPVAVHKHEVTEKDVAHSIEEFRTRRADLKVVTGGAVQVNDIVTAEVVITVGGAVAYENKEDHLGVYEEGVLGLYGETPASALVGRKGGDTADIDIAELGMGFPKEEFRGKAAKVKVKVIDIKRPDPPALDDAFAQAAGAKDMPDLRQKVKEGLEHRGLAEQKREMRRQVDEWLLAHTKFEMPADFCRRYADRVIVQRVIQLMQMGFDKEDIVKQREELEKSTRAGVEQDLRVSFVLAEIAKKEKIAATPEEVEGRIDEIAAASERPVGVVRREIEERDQMADVENQVVATKVYELLIGKAKVTEKAHEEPEKKEKHAKAEKTAKSEKTPKAEKTEKPEKKATAEKSEKAEKPEKKKK